MDLSRLYRAETIIRSCFFLCVLIGGAFLCAMAVEDFTNARASASWPTVQGVVLDGARGRYAYSRKGRNYESARRRFLTGVDAAFFSDAEKYATGQFVRVHVSPERPEVSVIEPGGSRAAFTLLLAAGAVFVFVGGGGLARSLSGRASGGFAGLIYVGRMRRGRPT